MIHNKIYWLLVLLLAFSGMQTALAQGYLRKTCFESNTGKGSPDVDTYVHDVTLNGDTGYVAVTFDGSSQGFWVHSDTYDANLGTNQTATLIVEELRVYGRKFSKINFYFTRTISLPSEVGFYNAGSYQIESDFQPSVSEGGSNGRVQFQTSSAYSSGTITILMKAKLVYTSNQAPDDDEPDDDEPESDTLNIENSYVQEYCKYSNSTFSVNSSNFTSSFFDSAKDNYADQPASRTIEFESDTATMARLVLSQQSDYSSPELVVDVPIIDGEGSYTITNLYPGKTYFYQVTADSVELVADTVITTGQVRMIALEKGFNIRDLGGWKGLGGKTVKYGQLYRGASLGGSDMYGTTSDITEADKTELYRLGIRAQLDLRAATNAGKYTNEGSYHSYSRGESTLKDACFANIMTDYGAYNQDASVVRDMAFIIYELKQGHPVYFNCRQGADRTGTIAFVIEGLLGCYEYANEYGGNQMALDYELTGFSGANRVDNWKVESSYRGAKDAYNATSKLFRQLLELNPSGVSLSSLQERCYYYLNQYFSDVRIDKEDLDWFIQFMLDYPEYSAPSWAVDGGNLKSTAETDANVIQHRHTITL